jgi:hypothetical protein
MTEQEQTIEGMKRNIEAQLAEYEQEIAAAKLWYQKWQAKRGFRCVEQNKREGV